MKSSSHRPFHLFTGHTYFVTSRCIDKIHYFESNERKHILALVLKNAAERFGIRLYAWIILNNHYHILFSLPEEVLFVPQRSSELSLRNSHSFSAEERTFRLEDSAQCATPYDSQYVITEFIRKIHKDSSRELNKIDLTPGRHIWYQYFDYCIRNKPDFWKHFNYIIQNPLKHGLVKTLYDAFNYSFPSNPVWLERFGKEGMWESFIHYPVKDWTPSESE